MLHAITRIPAQSLTQACLLTHLSRTPIDFAAALRQHDGYCATLQRWNVTVHRLDALADFPDSVFVEDAAVVLDEVVVFARSGAAARLGEPAALAPALQGWHRPRASIVAPGTLDGGDVLLVGRRLLIGLSTRTNLAGAEQLRCIAHEFGYQVEFVPIGATLHLKTACTALRDDLLLVNPAWITRQDLPGFDFVEIHPDEPFAANVLRLPDAILCDADSPRTTDIVRRAVAGHCAVDVVQNSEFSKAEGSLTCLSVVFRDTAV